MYLRHVSIKNVRSIEQFLLSFDETETAGWHVILGANGAGKSTVVRSIALALAGPKEAAALRQNWNTWQRHQAEPGRIEVAISAGAKDVVTGKGRGAAEFDFKIEFRPLEASLSGPRVEPVALKEGKAKAERSVWGTKKGWFSASFGPFRRFTGGDPGYDRLWFTNPRLASHLTAFGEDIALTEGLRWLRELRVRQLEAGAESGKLLEKLVQFLNASDLLPHDAKIEEVRAEEIILVDANGFQVAVEQMSDGYRSVLSTIFEILRQMTKAYGIEEVYSSIDIESKSVKLPGVVVIDEIDAHLHPTWQRDIGPWFTRCFPEVQFIVTTHSPIVCRAATSVWRLPEPGTEDQAGRVEGVVLQRLIHGSILEAYGTEYFGRNIARSDDSKHLLTELAVLNRKALRSNLTSSEAERMRELRDTLPTEATDLDAEPQN
ncbi:AAA family ATPase [Duganella violaceipulchra]|uniref:ATPase n=1 Tax=Duganella violaceipulchra TaxID=2849652 RepID=A0AA41H719_9BURK|nr:AAA family ATPase [Duganella violaceicalia]MBV6320911.1 AAA family ATPase [Duganella violaceicalia]MCP2008378.1 putative ATPase [Duganella violaceicalia]